MQHYKRHLAAGALALAMLAHTAVPAALAAGPQQQLPQPAAYTAEALQQENCAGALLAAGLGAATFYYLYQNADTVRDKVEQLMLPLVRIYHALNGIAMYNS